MSNRSTLVYLIILLVFFANFAFSQAYPPQTQLVFDQMPNVAKPGYLSPITDPTFGSTVIRISDQAVFNTHSNGMSTYHQYAKGQPWNSDGTMIKLAGWSNAILDAQTYQVKHVTWLPGGHNTWANTKPNIIYGSNHPNYDGNCIAQNDVTTNTTSLVYCFNEYKYVSYGMGEGNMSNDDRYMALQCRKSNGAMEIACYDFVTNSKVSSMPAPVWPNNVTMSQSGNYVIVQWDVQGTGPAQGVWAYNRSNMSPVRNLSRLGGSHFDYGYDTQGNEVMVGPNGVDRGIRMVRIDNGVETALVGDNKMSWYIHVSCRNLNRPGWAYYTEFANQNTQTFKANYQKIFSVKLDPNANNNALTETFAHVHHSPHVDYNRSPFGTPNRDGSKVMFRSDWEGNASSEINSYVAYMPGSPCNLSCTVTQIAAPTCGNNNGQATANPTGGTAPFSYAWSNGQTSATANGLAVGSYTVNLTDANNCSTSCNVTITGASSLSCTATQTTAPTCGGNNGVATATAQGGTSPYTYAWSSSQNGPIGQTTPAAVGLSGGSYTVVITDANNCSTNCTVTLTNINGSGRGAFANVSTQSAIAWNGGAPHASRPKPALGVWEPGDVPGTEIMRVSDASGNGLHYFNTRQVWNSDMTKLMMGSGVVVDNKVLDATNNYAVLPNRVPLNSNRIWSNTNPDIVYGSQGQTDFAAFNVVTGVTTILYSRPLPFSLKSKGNLPGDDSKIAFYEPSTNKIISYNMQTNSVIAEIVWPYPAFTGGDYVTYDWTGNWIFVGTGSGGGLYRMTPNLTNITKIYNDIEHYDFAYNTNGESVQVQTNGDGSVDVINVVDASKNYTSPIFGGADPAVGNNRATPDYVSGRGQLGAPGWVAFGGESESGSPNHPLGLYKIDGNTSNATIKVIGFDHHSSAPTVNQNGSNDRQKPVVSPDGNEVIFTSDWGVPNGPLSAYIIRGTEGSGTACAATCNLGVWLEGVYDMNAMKLTNGLQQRGVLPSGQPYNNPPWNYNGSEGGGWQQSDYPAGAIDWVLISLRTSPQPSSEVAKAAALLMEDGTILPASIELNGSSETAFYIVVEHRNHIPAMTPTAIPLVNNTLTYDFRVNNSFNAGVGFGQTQLGTEWALFAGEVSQSSPVGYEVTGADNILWQSANGNFSDYMPEDTNLDGDVNGMDRILLNRNNGISSSVQK